MKSNIIVLSYNRPRMLREAIDSLLAQTNQDFDIWLFDDGSDFDIEEMAWKLNDTRIILCRAPRVSSKVRVSGENSWVDNINEIVFEVAKTSPDSFITYLCDDDLLHKDWLSWVSRGLTDNPSFHAVLSDMYYFQDGELPFEDGKKGFPAQVKLDPEHILMWWNLGAFAYRSSCVLDCGVVWGDGLDGFAHSYDISLIENLKNNHSGYLFLPYPSVYRREHKNTLSYRMGRINEDGFYTKAAGEMLPEHVEGFLE